MKTIALINEEASRWVWWRLLCNPLQASLQNLPPCPSHSQCSDSCGHFLSLDYWCCSLDSSSDSGLTSFDSFPLILPTYSFELTVFLLKLLMSLYWLQIKVQISCDVIQSHMSVPQLCWSQTTGVNRDIYTEGVTEPTTWVHEELLKSHQNFKNVTRGTGGKVGKHKLGDWGWHIHPIIYKMGLPRWLSGKESTCQCRRHEFNPRVRILEKEMATHPMDRATVHGVAKESDTTSWLNI